MSLHEAPARVTADLAGIDRLGTDRRLRTEQVVLRIDDLPGRPEVDRFCRCARARTARDSRMRDEFRGRRASSLRTLLARMSAG